MNIQNRSEIEINVYMTDKISDILQHCGLNQNFNEDQFDLVRLVRALDRVLNFK